MTNTKISLEAARVNAHLLQTEVAEKMGVSRSTIHNWESGKTSPDVVQADKLCEIYGMPRDVIFFTH